MDRGDGMKEVVVEDAEIEEGFYDQRQPPLALLLLLLLSRILVPFEFGIAPERVVEAIPWSNTMPIVLKNLAIRFVRRLPHAAIPEHVTDPGGMLSDILVASAVVHKSDPCEARITLMQMALFQIRRSDSCLSLR